MYKINSRTLGVILLTGSLAACGASFSQLPDEGALRNHIATTAPQALSIKVPEVDNVFLVKSPGQPLVLYEFEKEIELTTEPALEVKRNVIFSECEDVVRRDLAMTVNELYGDHNVCVIEGLSGALYQFTNGNVRWIEFNATHDEQHKHVSSMDITQDHIIYRN